MNNRLFVYIVCLFLLTSCFLKKDPDCVAEVKSESLYLSEIKDVMPVFLTEADSIAFVENFIENWVKDMLILKEAEDDYKYDSEIEKQVEDYRRFLILQRYQQRLLSKAKNGISEEQKRQYYQANLHKFVLNDFLIKGIFLKVPSYAPNIDEVADLFRLRNEDDSTLLEQYSLMNATQFIDFSENWKSGEDMERYLSIEASEVENKLSGSRLIEKKDSVYTYFLKIVDYEKYGSTVPYEYVESTISDLLRGENDLKYINNYRDSLFVDAKQRKIIKYIK
ncbi:MAG: hypothetical protein IJ270_05460 [Paludibacteraceae bacterium]|nr:hypothetical protein [Paludibacteraceae bacterium]